MSRDAVIMQFPQHPQLPQRGVARRAPQRILVALVLVVLAVVVAVAVVATALASS